MTKRISISLITIFLCLNAYTQQIKIVDAENNLPIPNAHICTESTDKFETHFWVTNADGLIKNSLKNKSKAAITFVGYNTLIDSIEPGKSYTFSLHPSTESLSEVIVTGQISPKTVDQSIYKVEVINSKQIENKAANNLADLLSNELNVRIGNNGVLGSSIQMQGLSGEHIKILVDGVPVIGRLNGNIDLGQLNLQNIDHVEIVEGPMSVVYGSNALAGAINLITKSNNRPKLTSTINTYYESVGSYNVDAMISSRIKNHHVSATGARNFFSGYSIEGKNTRTFDFNPKEQYSGTLNYKFSHEKYSLGLTQELFSEELVNYGSQFPDSILLIDESYYAYPKAYDEYHKTMRFNTKGNFQYKLNKKSQIEIMAAYSNYEKTKQTYSKNLNLLNSELLKNNERHDTATFNAIISRGTYSISSNKIELQSGYDFINEKGTGKRIDNTKEIGDYAGFFSLTYSPIKTLSFQGGGRAIYNTKFKAPIVYSINTKWDPVKNFNIRASYGKGFRSPSIKELYLNFIDVNHEVKGNENLKAEHSQNYNLNFLYKKEKDKNSYTFSLKLYHNRILNKIDFLYDSINAAKADYINIDGTYKTIGGQFDITYAFHPRLEFKTGINYSGYSKMVNLNEYTFTPDYITMFNYHNMAYHFRINIYYKYNGKKSQFYETVSDGVSTIEERYISAYNMLDLTISKPFLNEKLVLAIGAKNLLNVKTVDGTGGTSGAHSGSGNGASNIAWGRTIFVKLKYSFTKF